MSYYDWVKTFEMLKTSPMDEKIIEDLKNKTLDGNDYVLERLVNHAIKTINTRLNNCCENCVNRMLSSNSNVNDISMDLINVKKEKKFTLKIIDIPIFDKDLKEKFRNTINDTFNDIYSILKSHVEYIDNDGTYISAFEKIMLSNMED